jgi:hypothetical protein
MKYRQLLTQGQVLGCKDSPVPEKGTDKDQD